MYTTTTPWPSCLPYPDSPQLTSSVHYQQVLPFWWRSLLQLTIVLLFSIAILCVSDDYMIYFLWVLFSSVAAFLPLLLILHCYPFLFSHSCSHTSPSEPCFLNLFLLHSLSPSPTPTSTGTQGVRCWIFPVCVSTFFHITLITETVAGFHTLGCENRRNWVIFCQFGTYVEKNRLKEVACLGG